MPNPIDRRTFASTFAASVVLGSEVLSADTPALEVAPMPHTLPRVATEAPFTRDYPAPKFTPSWRNQQINRLLVQDFVVFAHSDFDMVKKLLDREPGLLNTAMDWGAGDIESGLNAAAHIGRHDIVEMFLERGARIDIFCAAMMGQLDAVRAFLTLQPKLIDARGPHGFFNLHVHAQYAKDGGKTLDYLQSIKKIELRPFGKKTDPAKKPDDKTASKKPE